MLVNVKKLFFSVLIVFYVAGVIAFDSSVAYNNYVNALFFVVLFAAFVSKQTLQNFVVDKTAVRYFVILLIPVLISSIDYFFYGYDTTLTKYMGNILILFTLSAILKSEENLIAIPIGFFVGSLIILFMGSELFISILASGKGRIIMNTLDEQGSSINSNVIAITFGMTSLFLYQYCLFTPSKVLRIISFLLSLFLMYVTIQTTGSKKGLLIIASNLLYITLSLFSRVRKGKKTLFLPLLLLLLGIAYYGVNGFLQSTTFVRFESLLTASAGDGSSNDHRKKLLEEGLNMWFNHPFAGTGFGSFSSLTTSEFGYSHNNYIEILVSVGILGIIFYYAFYLSLLKSYWRVLSLKFETSFVGINILIIFQLFIIDIAAVTYSMKEIFVLLAYLMASLKFIQAKAHEENHMCNR